MDTDNKRYCSKKIFVSTFIFACLMIVILHAALISMIRHDYEWSGKILAKQISDNFYSSNTNAYDVNTDKFIKDYPAVTINIYNQDAKKIISSNETVIKVIRDPKIMDYVAGYFLYRADNDRIEHNKTKGFSQVIWSADYQNKEDGALMRIVEPMFVDQKYSGSIEIYYDFSHHLRMMDNTRFFCILLILAITAVYFMLIEQNICTLKNDKQSN